jgi:hypothetical protein
MVRQDGDDWEGAAGCWRRLVDGGEGAHFASVDAGLRGHKSRHNLAVAYLRLNRPAEAEEQWRRVAEEVPAFAPAWLGLGWVGVARSDRALVELATARLGSLGESGRTGADELHQWLASGGSTSQA